MKEEEEEDLGIRIHLPLANTKRRNYADVHTEEL